MSHAPKHFKILVILISKVLVSTDMTSGLEMEQKFALCMSLGSVLKPQSKC